MNRPVLIDYAHTYKNELMDLIINHRDDYKTKNVSVPRWCYVSSDELTRYIVHRCLHDPNQRQSVADKNRKTSYFIIKNNNNNNNKE